jgi:saccharopine dehydrogenase-like NADP-dependent oxidoreductase
MRILIIGGYGNFGSFISKSLAQDHNITLIIAGRSLSKAQACAKEINAEAAVIDINSNFTDTLHKLKPNIVIHTSGPFQAQGYDVAQACISCGAHYIDLADGREFVAGIEQLDDKAKAAGVMVISGASSVPCLTSALIDHYKDEFAILEELNYGITTAQKTARGLATTAAILSYTGKGFVTVANGKTKTIFGWQSLHAKNYAGLGWRLLGNCNIPDLALFPKLYPQLKTVRFYAGLELPFVHITLWGLSWLVRVGLIKNLQAMAPLLLKLSFLFDWLGSENSGFHMTLIGKDHNDKTKTINFELIARSGDGPYIPCMPAILSARKLANGIITSTGATACIGIIDKNEYLTALKDLDISWTQSGS